MLLEVGCATSICCLQWDSSAEIDCPAHFTVPCAVLLAGNAVNARCELGATTYQPNILGTKGPRKMTVLIPKLDMQTNRPLKQQPKGDRDSMLNRWMGHAVHSLPVRMQNWRYYQKRQCSGEEQGKPLRGPL